MVVIDILVELILFLSPCVIFEIKRRKSNERLADKKLDLIFHILIGIFFAFTYIPYRYFYKPWRRFSFLHIYGLLSTLIMPFVLAYLCKGTNWAKGIAIALSLVIFISPITRPIFLPKVRKMTSIASWDMAIPFNVCNISALIYIFGVVTKSQVIKNYMITFGLFGGIINNVDAHNTHIPTFWYYLTWESYFVHSIIIVIPIFMVLTGQIKPDIKKAYVNALWLLPFYIFAGFFLNPLWKTNFHFTKPSSVGELLPQMSHPLHIFGEPVDPLYMSTMIVIIGLFTLMLYYLCEFLYKYLRPKYVEDNKYKYEVIG